MLKKSILCLSLMFLMMFSSCATMELQKEVVKPLPKVETFFPQENMIEYVLDSSIKKFPKDILENGKISFLGLKTNFKNQEVIDSFTKYFVNRFESTVSDFSSLEESDMALHISLDLTVDTSISKMKRPSNKTEMKRVSFIYLDKIETEPKYDLNKRRETMLLKVTFVVIGKNSAEAIYFDNIVCISIYDSTDIQKQH